MSSRIAPRLVISSGKGAINPMSGAGSSGFRFSARIRADADSALNAEGDLLERGRRISASESA
jgi:hypothetical protein